MVLIHLDPDHRLSSRPNCIRLSGIRQSGIRLSGIRLSGTRLSGIRLSGIRYPSFLPCLFLFIFMVRDRLSNESTSL